jgi:hypothetical protein
MKKESCCFRRIRDNAKTAQIALIGMLFVICGGFKTPDRFDDNRVIFAPSLFNTVSLTHTRHDRNSESREHDLKLVYADFKMPLHSMLINCEPGRILGAV